MLVPEHPQPVGRRRAVAEMTVAWQQAAPIAPGHVSQVPAAPAATPVPPPILQPDAAPAGQGGAA